MLPELSTNYRTSLEVEMITLIVTYHLSATGADYTDAMTRYLDMTPNEDAAGLVRTDRLFDAMRGIGGACYTFNSREDTDAWFDKNLVAHITQNYSANLKYFETPVVMDKHKERIDETRYEELQKRVLSRH